MALAIVVVSYRQTVHAYETSGGAYVVARENLGVLPSLVAGASLLFGDVWRLLSLSGAKQAGQHSNNRRNH